MTAFLFRIIGAGRAAKIAAALIWCALVAAAVAHLPQLSFDNDTWLPADNPLRVELENFRAEFEPDEALLVAVELPRDFFAPAMTLAIKKLDAAIAALPQVKSALSPLSATVILNRADALEINSFGDALDKGLLDADSYQRSFSRSPYAGKLLSPDHHTVAVRAAIARAGAEARASAAAAVAEVAHEHAAAFGGAVHFAGEAALKDALNRATREQLPRLLAVAALVLAVFLRLACGNWRRAALVFTAAAAAVGACLGLMAAFGWPMNAVLLALPVMVAVIAVADALHILARWDGLGDGENGDRGGEHGDGGDENGDCDSGNGASGGEHGDGDSENGDLNGDNAAARLVATIRQTYLPCLGATVTSAVGFGAFAVSELTPLRHFGFASAAAIVAAYPLIVGALWGGLWLAPPLRESPPSRINWSRLAAALRELTGARAKRVAAAAVALTVALGGGLAMARAETNFLTVFFAEGSEVRRAFDRVDADLGGSGRVEVTLRGAPETFATAAALAGVERLAGRAAAIATVNHVDSYLLPVAMAHAAFAGDGDGGEGSAGLPATDAELAQELLFLELSRDETRRDVLSPYLDFNHGAARLSLQTPNLNSDALSQTIAAATVAATDTVAETAAAESTLDITVTGFGVFIHNLGQLVLRAQAVSLALTLAVIAALLLAQFGLRAGLCGVAANALPLAATAGLVAWLGHPYDFAAILIAGVTLGLSVDDTIHFLHHYRRGGDGAGNGGGDVGDGDNAETNARARALNRTTRPIVLTSALFICGLAVVGLSDLVVLRKFAAFATFGITAALVSTLIVLPALLKLLPAGAKRKPKKTAR